MSLGGSGVSIGGVKILRAPGNEKTYPIKTGRKGTSSTQKCPFWRGICEFVPRRGIGQIAENLMTNTNLTTHLRNRSCRSSPESLVMKEGQGE